MNSKSKKLAGFGPRVIVGLLAAVVLNIAACEGVDPQLTFAGTGSLDGFVFFDASEDGIFDPSDGDYGISGVGLTVFERGTQSTVSGGTASSDAAGRFSMTGLPAGTHDMFIDTLTVPAGVSICQNPVQVTVFINETGFREIAGQPGCLITIAEAKDGPQGEFVIVRGIVTGAPGQVETGFTYIEDATAGTNIFGTALEGLGLNVGDRIEVGGITSQFSNDFQLTNPQLREVVADFAVPVPVVVTTGALAVSGADYTDPIQGAFIRVEKVQLTVAFGGAPGGNLQNALIDDGSGVAVVRVDDGVADRNGLNGIFSVGTCYNMNGFGANFAGSGQIFPRSLADIEEVPCS